MKRYFCDLVRRLGEGKKKKKRKSQTFDFMLLIMLGLFGEIFSLANLLEIVVAH